MYWTTASDHWYKKSEKTTEQRIEMSDQKSDTPEEPEEWRFIPTAPGYIVSNRGQVKNPKGKLLQYVSQSGGFSVSVLGKKVSVRRLVAEAFIGIPEDTTEDWTVVCKNFNPLDCRVSNLKWVKRSHMLAVYGRRGKYILHKNTSVITDKIENSSFTVEF